MFAGSFDRFDIAEAYHAFRIEWQASPCFCSGRTDKHHGRREETLQEIESQLQRIRFNASPMFRGYESLTENGKLFYRALCDRFGYETARLEGPEVDTTEGPASWASYLVNGDASGLEAAEVAQCDAWVKSLKPWYVVSTEGEPFFSHRVKLYAPQVTYDAGDLLTYVIHKPREA